MLSPFLKRRTVFLELSLQVNDGKPRLPLRKVFFSVGGQETCWSLLHYRFDPLRNLRTLDEAKKRLRSGLVVYNSQFRNTNALWSVIGNDHILVVSVDISWTMFKSYWRVCYLPSAEHNCETAHGLILLGPHSFTLNKKQNIHLKNYELFLLLNLSVSINGKRTYSDLWLNLSE